MTASANSDTELVTEHFGYPPVSLIDDIINSVNILAERALNSVEQGLLNAPPSSLGFKPPSKSKAKSQRQKGADDDGGAQPAPEEQAKTEIEAGTHQLETLLCASIDRNFDKFEIYVLRNVLCVKPADVRDWMRLSHYEGLDFSSAVSGGGKGSSSSGGNGDGDRMDVDAAAGGGAPTLDSINLLRRKLRESMRLNALLTAERARNDKMLGELRALVGAGALAGKVKSESASPAGNKNNSKRASSQGVSAEAAAASEAEANNKDPSSSSSASPSPFAFLHRKGDLAGAGGGATPLSTTAAFTLSQMQALRALSTSLRNVTPDLVDKQMIKDEDEDEDGEENKDDDDSSNNTNSRGDAEEGGEQKKKTTTKKPSKSWRRERLEYVEGATRRHLETVQGLELGRHGEVRDGEWQGEGRNLARGEVEGLERMVGLLEEKGGNSSGGGGGNGNGKSSSSSSPSSNNDNTTTTTTIATAAPASKSKSKSMRKEASADDDDDDDRMDVS